VLKVNDLSIGSCTSTSVQELLHMIVPAFSLIQGHREALIYISTHQH